MESGFKMLWLTTLLLLSCYARCAFVRDLTRSKRDTTDVNNLIIEIFHNCKCVYYYQCDSDNYIITSGESLINVRGRQGAPKIACNGTYEGELVCCRLRDNTTATIVKPIIKSPVEIVDVTDPDGTTNETGLSQITKKPSCGMQKTILNVRIFTGEPELTPVAGEFPWIAAIYRKKSSSDKYKFHCSGSLIHPKVVLTANHCVHRKEAADFRVIVNGGITLTSMDSNKDEERSVTEIVHHPEYYAGALYNDAALLILNKPYVSSKENFINTICLPLSDIQLENTKCLVAGYGKDNQGENKKVMKKVELPFVNFNRCKELLKQTRLGEFFNLHSSFMCAGGEKGKDACKGDGGSPLMCPFPSENRYFQIGIVSWGVGCGEENVPGVYGNVQVFSNWIKTELNQRQISFE